MGDRRIGNKFNLKHKELNEFYYQEPREVSYRDFMNRVKRQWYTKERAVIKEPIYKPTPKSEVREDGRVCNRCWEFKLWECYAKCKAWVNWRKSLCKDCTNAKHREYSHSEIWRKKNQEYRDKKRKLKAWQQILINNEVWEILEYQNKKWYLIRSIFSWEEKRFSASDNFFSPKNKLSVRSFRVLTDNIELVETKKEEIEEQTFEKPKFKLSLEDMFEDEYYN